MSTAVASPARRRGRRARQTLTPGGRVAVTAKYASLTVAAVVALLPLVVSFMTSFKTRQEQLVSGPLSPPRNWLNLHNFAEAFTNGYMLTAFVNTTIILLRWSCTKQHALIKKRRKDLSLH